MYYLFCELTKQGYLRFGIKTGKYVSIIKNIETRNTPLVYHSRVVNTVAKTVEKAEVC